MSARLLSPLAFRSPAASDGQQDRFLWLENITRFWRAYETRGHLAELDEHMLRDVGVTADEARREVMRKPWDLQGC